MSGSLWKQDAADERQDPTVSRLSAADGLRATQPEARGAGEAGSERHWTIHIGTDPGTAWLGTAARGEAKQVLSSIRNTM